MTVQEEAKKAMDRAAAANDVFKRLQGLKEDDPYRAIVSALLEVIDTVRAGVYVVADHVDAIERQA